MPYERKTADIFISEDLKNVLQEIESESLVAHLLLKKRHLKDDLVDDYVNYISISSQDKGRISYITQDRIEKISEEDEYWKSSKRYSAKPGSFVTKVFKNISPKEIEKFSNLFRAESDKPDFRFEVVSGDKIRELYHYTSVRCDSGSLGISCMKHDHCQKYLDVYTKNPDVVSMLAMFNSDGYVIGRALLWSFESYKLMDRIYTINDEKLSPYFKKWCGKNGYLHKSEQNWFNTLSFEQFGQKKVELKLKLTLPNRHFDYYPYMDTFKIIDNDGNLYNYHPEGVSFRTLCATDGRSQGSDYLRFDSISNVFRYPGDTVWLDYRELYTHHDNCYYSESMDCYILRVDAFYSEEARDYIFNESYGSHNDHDRINRRVSYYKEREEARRKAEEQRRNAEQQSVEQPTRGMEAGIYFESGSSFSTFYNEYLRFTDRFNDRIRVNRNRRATEDQTEVQDEQPTEPTVQPTEPQTVMDYYTDYYDFDQSVRWVESEDLPNIEPLSEQE